MRVDQGGTHQDFTHYAQPFYSLLSPKTSSRVFERSQQQSEYPKKGALLLNSPSDKGGFEIMNIIIAERIVERSALSFPSIFQLAYLIG